MPEQRLAGDDFSRLEQKLPSLRLICEANWNLHAASNGVRLTDLGRKNKSESPSLGTNWDPTARWESSYRFGFA